MIRLLVLALALFLGTGQGIALAQVKAEALKMPAIRMRAAAQIAVVEAEKEQPEGDKEAPECFRPLINIELSFVKRVCEPTDEQMDKIVAAAKEAHKAMASVVTPQGAAMAIRAGGIMMFMGPEGERMTVNPYHRVREDVAKLLEPLVAPEQYAKYVEEAKLRDEYERDAAIGIVLDMIDARLVLSAEQRKEIGQKLMNDWKEVDLQWLQNYRNNPQYMPVMPDELILPTLTEAQRKLWTAATRQKVTMFANLGQDSAFGFTEEWLKK
jgi:hypothetical protein